MEEEEEEEKAEEMKKKKMKTMKTKNNNQRIGFFIIAFDKNSIKWEDRSIAFLYIQRINLPKMQKDHTSKCDAEAWWRGLGGAWHKGS